MATTPEKSVPGNDSTATERMMVIDIGKRKRKRVKQLRKGEGSLAVEIENTIEQLKLEGALDSDAQTVVVVVQQKPKNNWMWRT